MQTQRRLLPFLVLILTVVLCSGASAQRMIATVTVNLERLPQQNQNKLMGINRIIEDYLNQTDWGPDDYEYDYHVDLEIFFESTDASISYEDRYSAQLVVSNRKDAVYNDKRWDFKLDPGFQLNYATQFDPFRSMIDFYIQMVLGHEYDKVKKFGGQSYFEEARQIAQNARFSSRFFNGWDKREKLIEDYLEKENEHFRYLSFLYYTGEWLYYDERDRETAKQYLLYAVKQLDRVPEEKRERFFNLNHYNLANSLADYEEYSTLSKVAAMDPDHADVYQRLLNRR